MFVMVRHGQYELWTDSRGHYNNLDDYIVSTDRSVKELITVPKNYSVELSGAHTTGRLESCVGATALQHL